MEWREAIQGSPRFKMAKRPVSDGVMFRYGYKTGLIKRYNGLVRVLRQEDMEGFEDWEPHCVEGDSE